MSRIGGAPKSRLYSRVNCEASPYPTQWPALAASRPSPTIRRRASGSRMHAAARVGVGTWLGLLFGTLAKLALCFTMLGVFLLAFVL